MPCDIGYRSESEAVVATPAPQTFESRTSAPTVDADLLEQLGQVDPVFLDWLSDLDIAPLLAQALERALAALGPGAEAEFAIRNGALAARAQFRDAAGKTVAEKRIAAVAKRWQMEVLRAVAELLDFQVTLQSAREGGRDRIVIEGEKAGTGGVREYLRIVVDAEGKAVIRLEHYASEKLCAADEARLLALAQKLGAKLVKGKTKRSGKPIPKGTVHKHPEREGGKA